MFLAATVVVLIVNTYVIASWWDWQFGASYGHRGFVDVLPLLAFGLAAFSSGARQGVARRAVVTGLTIALVALSVFQMLQYWYGVMPMSDLTWDHYRAVFLKVR